MLRFFDVCLDLICLRSLFDELFLAEEFCGQLSDGHLVRVLESSFLRRLDDVVVFLSSRKLQQA